MAKSDYLVQSSEDAYAGLEYRNYEQRKEYRRVLLGESSTAAPSWTQRYAGLGHAFSIQSVSSSNYTHMTRQLGLVFSGSEAQETSPVPATSSLFYGKGSIIKRIYAVTASVGNPNFSPYQGLSFSSVSGTQVTTTAAAINSGTQFDPFYVNISVPDRGELLDIRVWVEVLHKSASNGDAYGHLSMLGSCVLGIISPNVKFKSSIPIANSADNRTVIDSFEYNDIPSMYPLWIGSATKGLGGYFSASGTTPTWWKDRHMRTIFHDGASVENPFRITPIHGIDGTINPANTGSITRGSPNGAVLSGNDKPWISDARVQEGGNYGAAGSPPSGWLTGPGGTANTNEFATTGSNYGASEMLPAYPLLDAVMEVRTPNNVFGPVTAKQVGIRPGLRGSEIQGNWTFVMYGATYGLFASNPEFWFRQVRLELTYRSGGPVSVPSWRRARPSPKNDRPYPIAVVSGTVAYYSGLQGAYGFSTDDSVFDWATKIVYVVPQTVPYRTYGITTDLDQLVAGQAVYTQVTGALSYLATGLDHAHFRYKFLNNEFGTPFIPISSQSLAHTNDPDEEYGSATAFVDSILRPSPLVGRFQDLQSLKNSQNPARQLRDIATQRTSGSR